jgi:uncharacterized protein YbjQ (UPF0145 family)
MFKSNPSIEAGHLKILNLYTDPPLRGACKSCSQAELTSAYSRLKNDIENCRDAINKNLKLIPLVSTQSPFGWRYQSVGLVTAQTTTGTGIWSDLTTLFTDTFGGQSGVYNQKIAAGEAKCAETIRLKTLSMGCDAVIAVDIDYAEVGGDRAMLMVCMTGTAVRLENAAEARPERHGETDKLKSTYIRYVTLSEALASAPLPPGW